MKLGEARVAFTYAVGLLLVEGNRLGLALILDECKRSPETAIYYATHCRVFVGGARCRRSTMDPIHAGTPGGHVFKPTGIRNSGHTRGLAADVYVIDDGAIVNDSAPYAQLAAYWKTLHPLARWGGDFKTIAADFGHYSFEWEGVS